MTKPKPTLAPSFSSLSPAREVFFAAAGEAQKPAVETNDKPKSGREQLATAINQFKAEIEAYKADTIKKIPKDFFGGINNSDQVTVMAVQSRLDLLQNENIDASNLTETSKLQHKGIFGGIDEKMGLLSEPQQAEFQKILDIAARKAAEEIATLTKALQELQKKDFKQMTDQKNLENLPKVSKASEPVEQQYDRMASKNTLDERLEYAISKFPLRTSGDEKLAEHSVMNDYQSMRDLNEAVEKKIVEKARELVSQTSPDTLIYSRGINYGNVSGILLHLHDYFRHETANLIATEKDSSRASYDDVAKKFDDKKLNAIWDNVVKKYCTENKLNPNQPIFDQTAKKRGS